MAEKNTAVEESGAHREALKRRFLETGLDTFSPTEMLELLLFFAMPRRQNTGETANALMEWYGTLSAVMSAPMEELEDCGNMSSTSALLLNLVPEVVHAAEREEADATLKTVEQAGPYLVTRFAGLTEEVFYELCADRRGKILTSRKIGVGDSSSVQLNVRKLVENAILSHAAGVIIAHNHPGGDVLPSEADCAVTEEAKRALAAIGVELLDHIIVAGKRFASLREGGYYKG